MGPSSPLIRVLSVKKYGKIKEEHIAGKETISPEDKERERDDEAEEKD